MIFLYNCYGGTHSSSLASCIHLGLLPHDRVPSKKDILKAPYFDMLKYKDMGRIIYRGTDKYGNKVYSMGRGTSKVLLPALNNMLDILRTECGLNEKVVLINASPTVPPIMTLGGFLSRGLKLHLLGRPLLAIGAQQAYFKVVKLVEDNLKNNGYIL